MYSPYLTESTFCVDLIPITDAFAVTLKVLFAETKKKKDTVKLNSFSRQKLITTQKQLMH